MSDTEPAPTTPDAGAPPITRAVVLARGLGSRMRAASSAELTADQARAADTGVKAMIGLRGRPFLDFVVSELADAGITDVCLVIGPEHDAVRAHYGSLGTERVHFDVAIQERPLGTADAVRAARAWVGQERFLAINSDNFYPASAVAQLVQVPASGLVGYQAQAMVEQGNIPAERVGAFAVVESDQQGRLLDVIEKPDAATLARFGANPLVSMNCWAFGPSVFDAIDRTDLSPRGEYEIVDAVRADLRAGTRYDVVPAAVGVLDLSRRDDIAAVEAALADREVRL